MRRSSTKPTRRHRRVAASQSRAATRSRSRHSVTAPIPTSAAIAGASATSSSRGRCRHQAEHAAVIASQPPHRRRGAQRIGGGARRVHQSSAASSSSAAGAAQDADPPSSGRKAGQPGLAPAAAGPPAPPSARRRRPHLRRRPHSDAADSSPVSRPKPCSRDQLQHAVVLRTADEGPSAAGHISTPAPTIRADHQATAASASPRSAARTRAGGQQHTAIRAGSTSRPAASWSETKPRGRRPAPASGPYGLDRAQRCVGRADQISVSSASGLLNRNISTATGVSASTARRAVRRRPGRAAHRCVEQPDRRPRPSAPRTSTLQLDSPKTRTDRPVIHSAAGVLSTVIAFAGSENRRTRPSSSGYRPVPLRVIGVRPARGRRPTGRAPRW